MTQQELKAQMIAAMKSKDEVRLSVMRGLLAAATNELVAKGKKPTDELDEEGVLALIKRAAKQRKDSIEQFEKGGRDDLAQKERNELGVLEGLLPPELPREEIEKRAREKAAQLGITDKSKAGALIGALMKELKGSADGAAVKEAVERFFG